VDTPSRGTEPSGDAARAKRDSPNATRKSRRLAEREELRLWLTHRLAIQMLGEEPTGVLRELLANLERIPSCAMAYREMRAAHGTSREAATTLIELNLVRKSMGLSPLSLAEGT
jgi:hypothetical protein